MFTRIVVGAEIVAALVWAAPASASPNSVVAVAVNPQTARGEAAYGGGKPIEYAVQDAIDACNLSQGPGCVFAGATTNGCVGIAFYQGNFQWAAGPTITGAEGAAKGKLNASGGDPVLSAACADGTSDGFAPGT
jgi:Domain of unknown function (DUF4189)